MSQTPIEYIRTLVTEKSVDTHASIPAFEAVGHVGLSYEVFFEFLDNNISMDMQNQIRENLTKLDFANADVFDYLHHLINAMIIETGISQYAGTVKTKFGEFVGS
jgi:hypothetical protein